MSRTTQPAPATPQATIATAIAAAASLKHARRPRTVHGRYDSHHACHDAERIARPDAVAVQHLLQRVLRAATATANVAATATATATDIAISIAGLAAIAARAPVRAP